MKKLRAVLIASVISISILSSCNETNSDSNQERSYCDILKYEYYPVDGGYGLRIIRPYLESNLKIEDNVEYLYDSVPMGNEELVLPSYYNNLPILEIDDARDLIYDEELKTLVLPEKLEYIRESSFYGEPYKYEYEMIKS